MIFQGGCNHCKAQGHKRHECKEFIANRAKHNGELPPEHQGAREPAYDKKRAAQKTAAERKASTGKVESLSEAKGQDTEDDDEMSDFSESEVQVMV